MRGDLPTPAITDPLFSKDPVWLATKMFEGLQSMVPPTIPPPRYFPDPEALSSWHQGGKIPEHLADEFQVWLAATKHRSEQISEAKRRLRSILWSHATLIANGHADLAGHLREFLRRYWQLADLPLDGTAREHTVDQVVKHLTRGG